MAASTNVELSTRNASGLSSRNPLQSSRDKFQRAVRGNSLSVYNNRWEFIQKLMAIDEEHDRRKRERDKLKELEMGSSLPTNEQSATSMNVDDNLTRWLNSQVLDDNPDDNQTDDNIFSTEVFGQSARLSLYPECDLPQSPRSVTLETNSWATLPSVSSTRYIKSGEENSPKPKKKRQLRLPPILLPKIYTMTPRPLKYREFLTPTARRGPITDEEWEDLKYCRYIRQGAPKFAMPLTSSSLTPSLHF